MLRRGDSDKKRKSSAAAGSENHRKAKVSLEDLYKVFPAPMSPTPPISPLSGGKE